ncbi:MAG: hypothetical protein ACTTHM_02795 [Peptoanaerobacter stomatis]|uniref:hypothetical protein n=1 Tax=Peptoanaerobacter stomatis TaxID=796937 RepID=UPI003F9F0205
MKIQDVFESGREDDKTIIMQRHNELMKEIKEKKNSKIEKNENKSSVGANKEDQDTNTYLESLERIKAAAIAARIARGEEIAKAQEDFLSTKYPDMLSDAEIVKNKINNVLKKIEGTKTKKEAEEILQKLDAGVLTLPHGSGNDTVFDKAVRIIKEKK